MEEGLEKYLKGLLEKIKGAPVLSSVIIGILGLYGFSALKRSNSAQPKKHHIVIDLFIFLGIMMLIAFAVIATVFVLPPYLIWERTHFKSSVKLSLMAGYVALVLIVVILAGVLAPQQSVPIQTAQANASSGIQKTSQSETSSKTSESSVIVSSALPSSSGEESQPTETSKASQSSNNTVRWVHAWGALYTGVKIYYFTASKNEYNYIGVITNADNNYVWIQASDGTKKRIDRVTIVADDNWKIKSDDPALPK